jgi:hypothetical protein
MRVVVSPPDAPNCNSYSRLDQSKGFVASPSNGLLAWATRRSNPGRGPTHYH